MRNTKHKFTHFSYRLFVLTVCTAVLSIVTSVIPVTAQQLTFIDTGQNFGVQGHTIRSGDIDADGDIDILLQDRSPDGVRVFVNDGTGGFTPGPFTAYSNGQNFKAGDIDGDGDTDIVSMKNWAEGVRVWRNDGTGAFTQIGSLGLGTGGALGDLDGDGDLDLVVATFAANGWQLFFNNGSGSFTLAGTYPWSYGKPLSDGAVADLDGDGDLDVHMTGDYGYVIFTNDGSGTFTEHDDYRTVIMNVRSAIADMDGDGDIDILATWGLPWSGWALGSLFRNDGNGTFTHDPSAVVRGKMTDVDQLGDLDNDGDIDVFSGTMNNPPVWLNNGNGSFSQGPIPSPSTRIDWAVLEDFDGDGDLDAASSAAGNNRIVLWENTIISSQPPVADAGADQAICAGAPVQIGGSPTGSGGEGGPYTYSWTPTTGLDDATVANPNASPAATTTYTVEVTETSTGLSATDDVLVTVNPSPVADAGSDVGICAGATVAIGGSPTGSGGNGSPYTYSWTPTTGLDDATAANPNASPAATTTYSVIVTDAAGCTATDDIVVTVNTPPTADAGADVDIVTGSSTVIGGSPTAGGGTAPYTYSWTPTTGLDDATLANPTASPTDTTTYTVLVTDASGCTATDDVTVNVLPLVSITLTPITSTTIPASGGSFQFQVEITNNSASAQIVDVWNVITKPGGGAVDASLGPWLNISLAPGQTLTPDALTQNVPAGAPPGAYGYVFNVGTFPGTVLDSDNLPFNKTVGPAHAEREVLMKGDEEPALPEEFALGQNYPNPFNPSTTIAFDVPETGKVKLTIHNMMGQLVKTLYHGQANAGHHQVVWNAKNEQGVKVASGVYIYKLEANNFQAMKRLILMK